MSICLALVLPFVASLHIPISSLNQIKMVEIRGVCSGWFRVGLMAAKRKEKKKEKKTSSRPQKMTPEMVNLLYEGMKKVLVVY